MELNNKLLAVGFVLAFANLGSVTAQADQTGLGTRGEFFTITAEDNCFTPFFPNINEVCLDSELYEQSRKNLNYKAAETCSGRCFSIDESSIQQTMDTKGGKDGHIYTVRTTARVFCINGE